MKSSLRDPPSLTENNKAAQPGAAVVTSDF
jgi:hypothetical protein